MKMARFNGYPIALWSSLSPSECHLRLVEQFHGAGVLASHATSDKRITGWQEGRGFVIYPWPYQTAGLDRHSVMRQRPDTSRMCRIKVQPYAGGTLISGSYTYTSNTAVLMTVVLGITFGVIFGFLFVLAGIIMVVQDLAALWLAVIGAGIWGVCFWLIADSSDGGFLRERAHIAQFLMQVLEAQPADLLDRQSDEKQVQKQVRSN